MRTLVGARGERVGHVRHLHIPEGRQEGADKQVADPDIRSFAARRSRYSVMRDEELRHTLSIPLFGHARLADLRCRSRYSVMRDSPIPLFGHARRRATSCWGF